MKKSKTNQSTNSLLQAQESVLFELEAQHDFFSNVASFLKNMFIAIPANARANKTIVNPKTTNISIDVMFKSSDKIRETLK